MKVLGIDPGTIVMGYGVIECDGDQMVCLDCGAFKTSEKLPIGQRLSRFYNELVALIQLHRPEVVAVEQPFVALNARSALAIGRAQAVALLAAANLGIPTFEYTPAQVKQRVASYGASSKEQVQEMVRLQLGMAKAPHPPDAADALAVAICHLAETQFNELVSKGQP